MKRKLSTSEDSNNNAVITTTTAKKQQQQQKKKQKTTKQKKNENENKTAEADDVLNISFNDDSISAVLGQLGDIASPLHQAVDTFCDSVERSNSTLSHDENSANTNPPSPKKTNAAPAEVGFD